MGGRKSLRSMTFQGELRMRIAAEEALVSAAEDELQALLKSLQAQYEEGQKVLYSLIGTASVHRSEMRSKERSKTRA